MSHSKLEIHADALRSILQIGIPSVSFNCSGPNKKAKEILLGQVEADDKNSLKKLVSTNTKFLPTVDSEIGRARGFVNEFKKEVVTGDPTRGYGGIAPTGAPTIFTVLIKDFERFEEIFDTYAPKVAECVANIRENWEAICERGRAELGELASGARFPTVDRFLKKSELTYFIAEGFGAAEAKIYKAVSDETIDRIKVKAEESARERILAAHARPVNKLLDSLVTCIKSLDRASLDVDPDTGKKTRFRADNFRTVEKLVEEVRAKNFLNLPELETAAATAASLVSGVTAKIDTAERADKAREIETVSDALTASLAESGLL